MAIAVAPYDKDAPQAIMEGRPPVAAGAADGTDPAYFLMTHLWWRRPAPMPSPEAMERVMRQMNHVEPLGPGGRMGTKGGLTS